MKNKIRLIGIGLIGIFIIQSLTSPTTQVAGSNNTNFVVGDTFTFQLNKYDFVMSENGTDYIDIGNYTLVSIGEPIDVQVNNITEIDPTTGESNISSTINFQNPSLNDPLGNFTTLTDNWQTEMSLGALVSALFVGWFDPTIETFNETDPQPDSLPLSANTSFIFFDGGGELLFSFFVGSNDTFVNEMYEEYILLESDNNFTGDVSDGFSNRSSYIEVSGTDNANLTEYIFQRMSWNNITKLIEFEVSFDMLNFGTFNSGSSYYAHSNFNFKIQADYNLGIVTSLDYYLLIETSVLDASSYLLFNYGFVGDVYTPPVTTSSTTIATSSIISTISGTETVSSDTSIMTTTSNMGGTDTSDSDIDTVSTSSSNTGTTTTTGLETSVTDVDSSSQNEQSPDISSDDGSETLPVNFSTPVVILFSLLILTTNHYKRRK